MIQNDEAAQLLCAVYNQKPWLAVKRLSLFDAENYPQIFSREVIAAHIVVVDAIALAVERGQALIPDLYRKAWKLTKLTTVYLVGQILRSDPNLEKFLREPEKALANSAVLGATLDRVARSAAATLRIRADEKRQDEPYDDYKVEFKRETALRDLGKAARRNYINYVTTKNME